MAELVGKLREKLDAKGASGRAEEEHRRSGLGPSLDRLTIGVDLGDEWSSYCILGLGGEALGEGQLRTTQQDFAEFFQALHATRVVLEVGIPWDPLRLGAGSHLRLRARCAGR